MDNFYISLLDNLYDGVYFVDTKRNITFWSKGAERITGYSSDKVLRRSCSDNILNHISEEGVNLCKTDCPLLACMNTGQAVESEIYLHHADGHRLPVRVRAIPIRDKNDNIIGAVESFSGISHVLKTRRQLDELEHAAFHDELTGLPNRRYLESKLAAGLIEVEHGLPLSILFIDIDGFKNVNDTHGHSIGDQVLKMLANTLTNSTRPGDIVGRWGGEEFIGLFKEADHKKLYVIAEKIRTLVMHSRFDKKDNIGVSVTISIGGTSALPGDTSESLVERADKLMYQSKLAGRNRSQIG